MIVKEILDKTTQFFKDKKIESARLDSEILISKALGLRRIDLYLKFEQPLKEQEIQICRDFVRRRAQGEPVAYILGQKDFYNLTFLVDSRVLVPRPETELLVEQALGWMKSNDKDSFRVADLGCGSGCIGLTVAKYEARAQVLMMDQSAGAIEVTRANQDRLGIQNVQCQQSRVEDFDFGAEKFDVVLANPPYIDPQDPRVESSVKKFEPAAALFAEENGLALISAWSRKMAEHLAPKALVIFEIGADQGAAAKSIFESLRVFQKVEILEDMAGMDRFVKAEK